MPSNLLKRGFHVRKGMLGMMDLIQQWGKLSCNCREGAILKVANLVILEPVSSVVLWSRELNVSAHRRVGRTTCVREGTAPWASHSASPSPGCPLAMELVAVGVEWRKGYSHFAANCWVAKCLEDWDQYPRVDLQSGKAECAVPRTYGTRDINAVNRGRLGS